MPYLNKLGLILLCVLGFNTRVIAANNSDFKISLVDSKFRKCPGEFIVNQISDKASWSEADGFSFISACSRDWKTLYLGLDGQTLKLTKTYNAKLLGFDPEDVYVNTKNDLSVAITHQKTVHLEYMPAIECYIMTRQVEVIINKAGQTQKINGSVFTTC
jgi:hypothetical protein